MKEAKSTPNQKLRRERERRGWSQQDVADKVGTTPLNVGRWERGVTLPGPHFRQQLSDVFEKSVQELGLVLANVDSEITTQALLSPPIIPGSQESPSSLWNVPYNRNLFFTGRKDILAHLRAALVSEEAPVALAQPQAISGLGGIGKTQTAVEYAYRYRDSYGAVLWVRADSADLLTSDFLLLAALLNLPQSNEQDQNVVVKAVINWLNTHEEWLLILDNADQLEMVSEFVPSAGKGHVLLTTRANSTGTIAHRIEIEKMGLEEGVLFLLRRAKLLKDAKLSLIEVPEEMRSKAQAIVEAVDGLPLALDQAGAYIEGTGCSLSDYIKFYKSRRNRLLRMRGTNASGHPEPVATTWSLSFEKVERANPAAAELLRLCAFLHPDEIPEAMIIEGASELGSLLRPVVEDELSWNEAIGELRKYSLVKRDSELKFLNIHRLVQAVLRDTMNKETQREWTERVVRLLRPMLPKVEFANWLIYQHFLPHAQTMIELAEQLQMQSTEIAQLLNKTGEYLAERGQYNEAKRVLLHALRMLEQTVGPEEAYIAEVLNNLGIVYWMQGNYEETTQLLLRAIDIQQKTLGTEHLSLSESFNNLGVLYNTQGKHAQAIPLYQRALAIREHVLSPDDLTTAYIITNLAVVYDDLGKYTEAEQLYKRSLAIHQRRQDTDHPQVGTVLNNLAVLYRNMGRFGEAAPLLEQSLKIAESTVGMYHPRRGTSLDNLAQNYRDLDMYDLAESTFIKALTLRRNILGSEHADIAYSLYGLASLYRSQGRYDLAESLYHEALAIRVKALGAEHPHVATSLYGLGVLYVDQGRYEEAEVLLQRSLRIREQIYAPDHPDVAESLYGLALYYRNLGKYESAEPLFERTLLIREQALGANHPEVAKTLENYAILLHKIGREDEAAILEVRVQAIRAKQE